MPATDRPGAPPRVDWLLADRRERKRPETIDLAFDAWDRGRSALAAGDLPAARRWAERAARLGPHDTQVRFLLGIVLLRQRGSRGRSRLPSGSSRLIDTGRAHVRYRFDIDNIRSEIAAQDADIAFIPSIWPETWCLALSDAWAAGPRTAVFDMGAQSERVAATKNGWILPLALPPRRR